MNAFDYDVLQKKRIARGARNMVRGSRSKGCSLPSDHLTTAQLLRRNGPVNTYKLDAPMTWGFFNEMPDDLKKEYIQSLQTGYGATDAMLAEMFRISHRTMFRMRTGLGLPGCGYGHLSKKQLAERDAKWQAFHSGTVGGDGTEEKAEVFPLPDSPETEPENKQPAPGTAPGQYLKPSKICAEFEGPFNVSGLMSWIAEFPFPSDAQVRIRVEVERV